MFAFLISLVFTTKLFLPCLALLLVSLNFSAKTKSESHAQTLWMATLCGEVSQKLVFTTSATTVLNSRNDKLFTLEDNKKNRVQR